MSESNSAFSAIRIGTRIRHTADGVTGRIVWANATTVKVQWDDGEKINWKRAELAAKGLEVLDADDAAPQDARAETRAVEPTTPESATAEAAMVTPAAPEITTPADATATAAPAELPVEATPTEAPSAEPASSETAGGVGQATKKRTRRTRTTEDKPGRVSALDAAARVLQEAGQPMSCQEMIKAMADKCYWTSPGGRTPSATLYSAILRELKVKGEASRFQKTDRGRFARTANA
jgi:HB1/ASXL restriction endonuclease-like protein with HTH domain